MSLTAEMQNALAARVIRPVILAYLDVQGDPQYLWTGPGNFAPVGSSDTFLNGKIFEPVGGIQSISDAIDDTENGSPLTINALVQNLDEPLLKQIIVARRNWHMRRAMVWFALLDEDEISVVADPVRVKSGVIKSMSLPAASGSKNAGMVSVVIDADMGKARGRTLTVSDHAALWGGTDTFGNYVKPLANRPAGLQGAHDVLGPGSGAPFRDTRGFTQFY